MTAGDTLTARLCASFAEAPEGPALHLLRARQPDQTITYAGLLAGAAGYARAYAAAGLLPGEVVVLILQHGAIGINWTILAIAVSEDAGKERMNT